MIWQVEFEIYKFPMKAIHLQVALMSPDTRGHDYFDLALGSHISQESPTLPRLRNIRGSKDKLLECRLSSCAWKPDRAPLTQNLKYQQGSIAAACYLLFSGVYCTSQCSS